MSELFGNVSGLITKSAVARNKEGAEKLEKEMKTKGKLEAKEAARRKEEGEEQVRAGAPRRLYTLGFRALSRPRRSRCLWPRRVLLPAGRPGRGPACWTQWGSWAPFSPVWAWPEGLAKGREGREEGKE